MLTNKDDANRIEELLDEAEGQGWFERALENVLDEQDANIPPFLMENKVVPRTQRVEKLA